MNYSRLGLIITLVLGILVLLLFLELFELPDDTFLLRELQDTGHTPLFGLLSLLVLSLSRLLLVGFNLKICDYYRIALVATMFLAVVSEMLQIIGPRDADLVDLLRDLAGTVSFLAVQWSFDRHVTAESRTRSTRTRRRWLFLGVILFLVSLTPLAVWQVAYFYRDAIFPQIVSFDSYLANRFLVANGAELKIVEPPNCWPAHGDNLVGRLILSPGRYPGLAISEIYPDWRGYDYLEFTLFSPRLDTVHLEVRINDRWHDNEFSDRYNSSLTVVPGLNQFSFRLTEVAAAPLTREMDMTDIRAVMIFAVKPAEEIRIYLDDIRLR